MRLSAALAYYSSFSLAPLLLIAMAIAGRFLGEDAVRGALYGELREALGPSAALIVQDMVADAHRPATSIWMSLLGVGLLLFGAGGVFSQLRKALNRIWQVEQADRSAIIAFLRSRVLAFSMVLVCGFLLLVSMIVSTMLQALEKWLSSATNIPIATWVAGSGLLSILTVAFLFAVLFRFLPRRPVAWRDALVGGGFTAILFTIGKYLIGFYLARQASDSSYAAAASFTAILTWLFYTAAVFLLGAEYTAVHSELKGDPPKKAPKT